MNLAKLLDKYWDKKLGYAEGYSKWFLTDGTY
jgi:hypothetical protein